MVTGLHPTRGPWTHAWRLEHRAYDIMRGVYRVGVSSAEVDRLPSVFEWVPSGGSGTWWV